MTLSCPIDGLTMTSSEIYKGDAGAVAEGKEVGKHLHLEVGTMTCSNGHQWRSEDLRLSRVA